MMKSQERSSIVSNGYCNLVKGFEEVARREIEEKYADEWDASGLFKRWRLQRLMDREVQAIVNKSMPKVSSEAIF